MNLRDAAQRVGILHLLTFQVRFANDAAFQHAAQVLRHQHLSGVGTRLVNALVEGDVGAFQRVQGESAMTSAVSARTSARSMVNSPMASIRLRAVDQRDGFLRLEHQRLDVGALHRVRRRHQLAFVVDLAFADQAERQMRKRRKVTAGAYASLRRNDRMHPAIQHFAEGVDHDRTHTAKNLWKANWRAAASWRGLRPPAAVRRLPQQWERTRLS